MGDFDFHALLHTYFTVPDIADVAIEGFSGDYIDKVADGETKTESSEGGVVLPSFTDRIYKKKMGGGKKVIKVGGKPHVATITNAVKSAVGHGSEGEESGLDHDV